MRRLRILQVATHKRIERGGAVQAHLLARELAKRGHEVTCVFNRDEKVETFDTDTFRMVSDQGIRLELYDMKSFRSLWKFRKFLKVEDFDVIHTHRDVALAFVLKSSVGIKLKSLYTNRGNNYRLKKGKRFYKSKKLDRIIAVAKEVKRVLVEQSGIDPARVEVVYGGVDVESFSPQVDGNNVRKEFCIDEDAIVVGNIAASHGKKGHLYFFEAAKLVIDKRPDVLFFAIGNGAKEKFYPIVKELGIDKSVLFTGFRFDMPKVIAALDLSVSSSIKGEGLTGSIRESLSMAKPVVCTDVAGNSEIVINEETGLLVPPKDSKSMAKAILYMIDNRARAKEMGEKGRRLVLDNFTNTKRCDRLEEMYFDILKTKGYLQT